MVLEAAAETVDDEAEKELAVKVWGKLVCQVIGGMKNGFLAEKIHDQRERLGTDCSVSGRAKTSKVNERTNLLAARSDRHLSKSLKNSRLESVRYPNLGYQPEVNTAGCPL